MTSVMRWEKPPGEVAQCPSLHGVHAQVPAPKGEAQGTHPAPPRPAACSPVLRARTLACSRAESSNTKPVLCSDADVA